MEQPDKNKAIRLRATLQQKLKAQAFIEQAILPFKQIQAILSQHEIRYTIADVIIPDKDAAPYIAAALKDKDFELHLRHTGSSDTAGKTDALFKRYPSTHSLRYVPPLPQLPGYYKIKEVVNFLKLKDQHVYVYYLRYALVIKLRLFDLFPAPEADLYNFWHGDMVIFPEDLSWLIAFSIEEEWYAGKYPL